MKEPNRYHMVISKLNVILTLHISFYIGLKKPFILD